MGSTKKTSAVMALIILCVLWPALFSNAQAVLSLSTWMGTPLSEEDGGGFVDLILTEAFFRVGVEINIQKLPAERSLTNANQGKSDGDFVRIAGLNTLYPHLIEVPEKIIDIDFVAFSRNISDKTEGWQSLKPFNVGIVTGWKILEKNIVGTKTLITVRNKDILFAHLDKDRVDMVVYSRFLGLQTILQHGLRDIKVLEPALASRPMFLYLHSRHADLVPKLVSALKEMKRDGTFTRIKTTSLSEYEK